uniref:Uncharacterized protein n=1 Tax=Rhizophora mucronata TaxID=61149 RepID=A0A2P2Q0M6_RHIMU
MKISQKRISFQNRSTLQPMFVRIQYSRKPVLMQSR